MRVSLTGCARGRVHPGFLPSFLYLFAFFLPVRVCCRTERRAAVYICHTPFQSVFQPFPDVDDSLVLSHRLAYYFLV